MRDGLHEEKFNNKNLCHKPVGMDFQNNLFFLFVVLS